MLKIKASVFPISIILLLLLTSLLYVFKQSYWAAEFPPFIFTALVSVLILLSFSNLVKQVHITLVDGIALVFFLYVLLSTLFIAHPFPPSDRLFNLIGCFLIYIVTRISNLFPSQNIQQLLHGVMIVVGVQAVCGLLHFFGTMPHTSSQNRIAGTFINPGLYGCFMAVGLVIILYLILIPKTTRGKQVLLAVIGLLVLMALLLSRSRTAYIAAAIGVVIVVFYNCRQQILTIVGKQKIFFAALVLLVLTAMMYFPWQQNTNSVSGRFLIWKISLMMFLDHPWFGMGYGNFFTEYGNYQADYFLAGNRAPNEVNTASMNYYTFNEFLKIAVENGLIGLLIFVLLIARVAYIACVGFKNSQPYAVVFLAILVVILIFGLFSYPFQDFAISTIFFFCIAHSASIDQTLVKYTPKRLHKTLLLIIACGVSFLSIRKINAIFAWRNATEQLSETNPSFSTHHKIYPVLSNNGSFLFNYGAEMAYAGKYEKAIPIFIRATKYGNSVEVHSWLADCYAATNAKVLAEQTYKKAANMNPKLFIPLSNLFHFYQKTEQKAKALAIAKQISEKTIKIPSNEIDKIKSEAFKYLQTQTL